MGSLIAGVLNALGMPAGPAGDAPKVPSAPVEIGTSGTRQTVSEAGSWQVLLLMFVVVLVLGALVLMYAVRQRARLVERRRVRRRSDVAAWVAAMGDAGGSAAPTTPRAAAPTTPTAAAPAAPPVAIPIAAQPPPATPPRTTPTTPDRSPPNA